MNTKGKSIITGVLPSHLAPVDEFGNVADVVIDPMTVNGRMNLGTLYEAYCNSASRSAKKMVEEKIRMIVGSSCEEGISKLTPKDVDDIFTIPLGLTNIFGTEQHESYLTATFEEKLEVIKEICDKELYLYYKVSSKRKAWQICEVIDKSAYRPLKDRIKIPDLKKYIEEGEVRFIKTDRPISITPMYYFLLSKTADNFLSAPTNYLNHFNIPIGVSANNRNSLPWKLNPVRNTSETEGRLFIGYGGLKLGAEIKDRANSEKTHRHIYRSLLKAERPSNVPVLVDRKVFPYGGDAALVTIKTIMKSFGSDFIYINKK